MKVRGLTILTRKMIVVRRFGAEAWARLYRDLAAAHACFRPLVTADSLMPLPAFLAFHDELVRRFFADDDAAHFQLGQESARWALIDGPYKGFTDKPDLRRFVAAFPELWKMYFADTSSWSEATLTRDAVEFRAFGLPSWHAYFEHFIMGYMKEALEIFCANPIATTRLRGGDDDGYHYLLHREALVAADDLDTVAFLPARAAGGDSVGHPASVELCESPPPVRRAAPQLSDRETEALLLVARGKTNKEIGATLGISDKTVQHHLARVYRKIAVSGRVGATMWLVDRGLVSKSPAQRR